MDFNKEWYRKTGHKVTEELITGAIHIPKELIWQILPYQNPSSWAVIRRLEKLIEEYPEVPQLLNYLSLHLRKLGEEERAAAVDEQTLRDFPNYFFGWVTRAVTYLKEGKPEKVPELLDFTRSPEKVIGREVLHLSEFRSWYLMGTRYYIAMKDYDRAKEMLRPLVLTIPEEQDVRNAAQFLSVSRMHHRFEIITKVVRAEKPGSYTYPVRTEAPKLHHPESGIWLEIDEPVPEKLSNVLAELPAETVVADLHAALADYGHRIAYYRSHTDEEDRLGMETAPVEKLLDLLPDYEDEVNWSQVLQFFRQSEDILEFWFGDWSYHVVLGLNSFFLEHIEWSELKEVFLYPGTSTPVVEGLGGIISAGIGRNPELREEIEQDFRAAFRVMLEDGIENARYGSYQTNQFVNVASNLGLVELLEPIGELFEHELFLPNYLGEEEEVRAEFENGAEIWAKYLESDRQMFYPDFWKKMNESKTNELMQQIESMQKDPVNMYLAKFNPLLNRDGGGSAIDEPVSAPTLSIDRADQPSTKRTFVRAKKKIGRNDPCVCGSGRKYKRCCG